MLVKDALDEFQISMEGVVSPKTLVWYSQKLESLEEMFGATDLKKMKTGDLEKWRASLSRRTKRYENHPSKPTKDGGMNLHTLHGHVRACRRFFKWCCEKRYLRISPAAELKKPPLPRNGRRGILQDDRDLIINAAKKSSERDYAIVLFLADTACRLSGIVNLRIQDIDFKNRLAVVHEKGRGGNNKARVVFFGFRTSDALKRWMKDRPGGTRNCQLFVATRRTGNPIDYQPLTSNGIYLLMKRLAKSVGISEGFNPHNWRHGAARGMLQNGASLIEVSQILGHSSVQVTGDHYGIYSEDELRRSHDQHSWIENALGQTDS